MKNHTVFFIMPYQGVVTIRVGLNLEKNSIGGDLYRILFIT